MDMRRGPPGLRKPRSAPTSELGEQRLHSSIGYLLLVHYEQAIHGGRKTATTKPVAAQQNCPEDSGQFIAADPACPQAKEWSWKT